MADSSNSESYYKRRQGNRKQGKGVRLCAASRSSVVKIRAVMLVGINEMSVDRFVRVPTLMTRPFLTIGLPKIVLGRLKPLTRSRERNEDLGGRSSALPFNKVQQCAYDDHNLGCITLAASDFHDFCH